MHRFLYHTFEYFYSVFSYNMPGGKSLDMPRTPYWANEGKPSQQPTMPYHSPPCPITPILTSSLYLIHLVIGLHCLYHITISPK